MIEIHLYGILRSLVEGSRASEDTIMRISHVDGESFTDLIERLGLNSA